MPSAYTQCKKQVCVMSPFFGCPSNKLSCYSREHILGSADKVGGRAVTLGFE